MTLKYISPTQYSYWETNLTVKMWRKSLDRENEINVRWHLPDWHVHLPMYLHTKYSSPIPYSYWETDLTTKMWRKSLDRENEVKVRWHLPDWHVLLPMYLHTKYSWPIPYSYWETDLITKMWRKFIEVTEPWKWGQGHGSYDRQTRQTIRCLYTKYGWSRSSTFWDIKLYSKS